MCLATWEFSVLQLVIKWEDNKSVFQIWNYGVAWFIVICMGTLVAA